MFEAWSSALAGDRHGVFAAWASGEGEIIGGRKGPTAIGSHEEAVVLRVVVAVMGEDVEKHADEDLVDRSLVSSECPGEFEEIVIGEARQAVVGVEQTAGCLHMETVIAGAIEASGVTAGNAADGAVVTGTAIASAMFKLCETHTRKRGC